MKEKLSKQKIDELKLQGLSYRDIGRLYGCTKQNVFSIHKEIEQYYRDNEDIKIKRLENARNRFQSKTDEVKQLSDKFKV